jgi:hypothetical protein
MAYGVCKLAGRSGQLVRSHLIPRALTRPSIAGGYFISGGPGLRPRKRWTSWYDEQLVIREGEDILRDYDNWVIAELRRLELVWSGWGTKSSLPLERPEWFSAHPEGFGIRLVECANPEKLRLFFLSLLWRAAATTLPEFGDISLEPEKLELLRSMVLNRDPRPLYFFPIMLVQIITRELPHNIGPFATDISFRFYFEGLIIHMLHNLNIDFGEVKRLMVGSSSTLIVQTQMFEHSFQFANAKRHIVVATSQWPEAVRKLTKQRTIE